MTLYIDVELLKRVKRVMFGALEAVLYKFPLL